MPVSVCPTPRELFIMWAPPRPALGKVESRNANIQKNLLATWQSRWPDWQCRQPVGKPCSQHLVSSAKEENMYSRNIWEEENLLHLHTQITPTQMHTSFLSSAPERHAFECFRRLISGAQWSLRQQERTLTASPRLNNPPHLIHCMGLHCHAALQSHLAGDVKNYLQLQSSGRREGQRARLISPTIYLPQSAVCMVFQYQAWGSNGVMLRVWREASQEHKALWVITEDQGEEWREGRIILPSYDMEYRIVFEGFIRNGHSGELALDDIRLGTDIPLENCMEPITAFPGENSYFPGKTALLLVVLFCWHGLLHRRKAMCVLVQTANVLSTEMAMNFPRMEDDFPSSEQDFEDNDDPGTPKLDKEKSWLYTLDPILVTIIAMSSLGVLLGAICAGLLLYCTCSYAGLSSRSSTTLENYNFELYDGIKHKVKMNHQKCCSEA
ncbi:hypothetical protein IHE44_0014354 [Lamprotornis superbus]|uniref:MAM domain-containing protein n=1 Tax=Lamprotornis superbus TaxID=245042 RepID=A0A835U0Z2_9PASS|nr:hypothetical protein IHE44_0014354 [Lamprotornis superbus]